MPASGLEGTVELISNNLANRQALTLSTEAEATNAVLGGKAHRIDGVLHQYWVTITPGGDADDVAALIANGRAHAALAADLRGRGVEKVTLVGLATDYCVAWSALDAIRLGFGVTVRLDACRAIDLDGSLDTALGEMEAAGVTLLNRV